MAIDGNSATKWFDYTRSALVVQLASPAKVEVGRIGQFSPRMFFCFKYSCFQLQALATRA